MTFDILSRGTAMQQPRSMQRTACVWGTAMALSPPSAMACVSNGDGFSLTLALIAFGVGGLAVCILAGLMWVVARLVYGRSMLFHTFFATTLVLALGLAVLTSFVVPQFERLFAGFGAELPGQTMVLFKIRPLLWLPAFSIAALWWIVKNNPGRTRYFGIMLLGESGLLTGALWALYSPLFKMGIVCG